GHIRGFDSAIFADTGWEPLAVYRHLNRLARIAGAAGIPVVRVSRGHIRRDAINPAHRVASMPPWLPRVHDFWSRFAVELGLLSGQVGVRRLSGFVREDGRQMLVSSAAWDGRFA